MPTINEVSECPFFEIREVGKKGKKAKVILRPMDKHLARVIFPYRPFNKYSETRFGGNHLMDDIALLLAEIATRCSMCNAPTKKEHIINGVCPDCDGRSEADGTDPHQKI